MGWADEADAPLADAQRAIRLIREDALRHRHDPDDVGVLGFSAGGHLAGRLLTQYDLETYRPVDDRDRRSARASYAGLIYPEITLRSPYAHTGSRRALVGDNEVRAAELSVETHIRPGLAPTFLASALDDDTVDPQNAIIAVTALRSAGALRGAPVSGGDARVRSDIAARRARRAMAIFTAWARRNGGLRGPQAID